MQETEQGQQVAASPAGDPTTAPQKVGRLPIRPVQALDCKVYGVLHQVRDDRVIPPDEFIVFRPHDHAVPGMLADYQRRCVENLCEPEQIAAVQALRARVDRWRHANRSRCKPADVAGEKILGTL